MHPERSSPNEKMRTVICLIIAITAALLVWLLCKVGFTLAPILAQPLIVPTP